MLTVLLISQSYQSKYSQVDIIVNVHYDLLILRACILPSIPYHPALSLFYPASISEFVLKSGFRYVPAIA